MNNGNYSVRPVVQDDVAFLWEMLYQAIYVEEGSPPIPRSILSQPEIARYVEGWGRTGDHGVIAVAGVDGRPVGAAWLRLFPASNPGYGFVSDDVPELSIAILPEHRGRGVGSQLLGEILAFARDKYRSVSLSVSSQNPAVKLYRRFRFEIIRTEGSSVTMRITFEDGTVAR